MCVKPRDEEEYPVRTKQTENPTFASLFCGCGGFDLGFTQADFECRAAFDIDPIAIEAYQANLGQAGKVRDLSKPNMGLDVLRGVDVLLAGPPCQGFSTAGRRDLNDPRNHLLLVAGEITTKVRPKVLVVENVTGVFSGAHKRYWDALNEMLRADGYHTAELRCDASEHGVPQMRKRAVLLAWRTAKDVAPALPLQPKKTLHAALANINGAPNHGPKQLPPKSESARIATRIAPGQKLCNVRNGARSVHTWDIPEVFGRVTQAEREVLETLLRLRRRLRIRDFGDADPVLASQVSEELGSASRHILERLVLKGYVRKIRHRYDLTHTFNGKFRRLPWDRPSYTVDTRFTQSRHFLHPDEDRGFTVREAARIQGFPDSFSFQGTETDQIRLVGNAVPPPLAHCLADYLRQALLS